MKRKPINPKEASLAATFYEPVYQRLRQWHRGQAVELLCFVHETNEQVRTLLEECGAATSTTFRAGCFAEVWELPHDMLLAGRFGSEASNMDQAISEAIGCQDGEFSAATGLLQWGDLQEPSNSRRHFQSRLLMEAVTKRGKRR